MKSLKNYITESSIKTKDFRFILKGLENTGIKDSILSFTNSHKVYTENIEGGIKVRIKPENYECLNSLIDLMTEFVNTISNDEKYEKYAQSLENTVNSMTDYMNELNAQDGE